MTRRIIIMALIAITGIYVSGAMAKICGNQVCGDANGDGTVNILDITLMIRLYNCVELGGVEYCEAVGDSICQENTSVDGNCSFTLDDIQWLIDYLYNEGPEPDCSCVWGQ